MEYISKEDVLSKLYLSHKDVTYIDKNAAADRIKKIQGIDIVRCKECKKCYKDTDALTKQTVLICQRYKDEDRWSKVNPDDFCSYGVKKGADDERSNNESAVIFR